jgi:CelD/BcsL family acetyltransferase involved in cellulose biosynthesis
MPQCKSPESQSGIGADPATHQINPLKDARWKPFMEHHPRSSVFHSVAWLQALQATYGYEPIAITTCPPGSGLRNALVCCRVESWLTGRRLVSLPFSDHCDLLADASSDWPAICSALENELHLHSLRYVEIRPRHPLTPANPGACSTYKYYGHQIDLQPHLDSLFRAFHKNCTQRKIRCAEREGLTYEEGRSESLLNSFYDLLRLTRRRHAVPSQPKKWFQSLIDNFGAALKIRVASKAGQPIAAILTLRHKDTLVYKYGCSDVHYHRLGGMHLLFWRSIQDAKQDGLCTFDLGRSECGNVGLAKFKDRWGAKRSVIPYLRLLVSARSNGAYQPAGADWKERAAKWLVPHLPEFILNSAGGLIYRHLG